MTNTTTTASNYTTRIAAHDTIAHVLFQVFPGDAKRVGLLVEEILAALSANGFTVTR
jgi:hypothetical protein